MDINKIILKPATKKEVAGMAKSAISEVCESGKYNPLELYALLKRTEEFAAKGIAACKKYAIDEYDNYNEREGCKVDGVLFSKYQMKDSVDFQSDAEYVRLESEITKREDIYLSELKTQLADRKELLIQAYNIKNGHVLDNDGAIVDTPKTGKVGSIVFKASY